MNIPHQIKYWAFAAMATTFITQSCSKNPVTGKSELMFLSESKEIAMGKESDPSIVASYGLYEDAKLQAFINDKGKSMGKVSHRANLNYDFKILDSPVVNAFALPGGYVYFTRGIMAHFNNEAEFAGVLGHEIGHVTARHSARQYSKQILAQAGMVVGVMVSEDFRKFSEQANQGLGLLFLKFSRDNETESDRLGVEYSTKIGYDALEMAGFFKTLDRLSGGSENRLPEFSSTHPDPVNRYENTLKLAKKWQQEDRRTRYHVNRNQYLKRIEGLVYGEDPRQGFVENNMFYHPELKLQFSIPQAWQTQNTPSQFQMAPKDGNAMMVLTLAQEKSLAQAANGVLTNYKLTKKSQKNITVNGLKAIALWGEQAADPNNANAKPISTLTYLIEYNGKIYNLMGMTYKSQFSRYESQFKKTMDSFNKLTDAQKLNKQPERIKIITVNQNGKLKEELVRQKIPTSRLNEFAILNGMELNDPITKGMLLKVVD